MTVKLITDSSCDLPLSYIEENSDLIILVGMPIGLDGIEYTDDLGKTLKHEFFYKKLEEGIFPTTSQVNTATFLDEYKKCYEKKESIIYLGLSSGLSGTMNNAELAKQMFLEEHIDADITIINTISASVGLGTLVVETVDLIRAGQPKEFIVNWLTQNSIKVNHWFAIDDLEHLRKGGRIPATIAFVGTALKVKPILTIAHDGKIKSYSSVRGRQKSIKYLYEKFSEHIGEAKDKAVLIAHGHCEEDALKLKDLIETNYKPKEIIVAELSATIATHVGSGMIAVAFMGNEIREDK